MLHGIYTKRSHILVLRPKTKGIPTSMVYRIMMYCMPSTIYPIYHIQSTMYYILYTICYMLHDLFRILMSAWPFWVRARSLQDVTGPPVLAV